MKALLHNLIAHPVMGLLNALGLIQAGAWLHDRLLPHP